MKRRDFLSGAALALSAGSATACLAAQTPTASSAAQPASTAPAPTAPPDSPVLPPANVSINVRDLGATGSGTDKDTVALQEALDRCAVLGGGEVVLPAGVYLSGALRMHSRTTLRVSAGASLLGSPEPADYPFTQVRWEGRWIKGRSALISAWDATDIRITGPGRIVASPEIRGRIVSADGMPLHARDSATAAPPQSKGGVAREDILRNPALLEFTHCRNVTVDELDTQGNDMWSTHPVYCENVTFRRVSIVSGADGIDVDSCRGVVIDGCTFNTADDCISLKSGRGMEGNRIGAVCEDVHIANCTFRDSVWACIGIGSETSAGIRRVLVEHCRCLGARTFAIYIKSRAGRGAFIEDITMRDLDVSGTGQGFLRINVVSSGLQDPETVPGPAGVPTVRNLSFSDVRVQDVPVLVDATGISPDKPLEHLTLRDITGTCGQGIALANVRNADVSGIHVTGLQGPLLATRNVTGRGLQGAAALPELPAKK